MSDFTNKSGFSLLEIMVIMTIIGIMVAITIPNFGTYNKNRRIEGAVSAVQSEFRRLRAKTIGQRHRTKIKFEPGTGTYTTWIDQNDDGDFSTNEISRVKNLQNDFGDVAFGVQSGISTSPNPTGGTPGDPMFTGDDNLGDNETVFYLNGRVLQWGAVFITFSYAIGVESRQPQFAVTAYRHGDSKRWRYIGNGNWRIY